MHLARNKQGSLPGEQTNLFNHSSSMVWIRTRPPPAADQFYNLQLQPAFWQAGLLVPLNWAEWTTSSKKYHGLKGFLGKLGYLGNKCH